jgi:diguanylate cyclase (GGDEF)-like protein
MPSELHVSPVPPLEGSEHVRVARALDRARGGYWEDPEGSLSAAIRCQELARRLGDPSLRSRSLALQGAITLHRGDLRGAFVLAAEAEHHSDRSDGDDARAELAALKAHLGFFSGSYAESLQQAELAVELADRGDDIDLQIFVRRAGCLVFGNVGVRDWPERIAELLRLTVESGNSWDEAVSRNDLGHYLMTQGELVRAEQEINEGIAIASSLGPHNRFVLAVLHCTRSEVQLQAGRDEEALADAERALALLTAAGEPNPYLFGMTVGAKVRALLRLGRLDDAQRSGEGALSRLGDRVPQARSMILTIVATALREAGRIEDAYDALARGAQLEREAFHELSELQLGLERATLATGAARREADALAAKNRQLEALVRQVAEAHTELERRTEQLEALQDQLRDQADRDWLTGLHNRRYLARELERLTSERLAGPFSVAVLDLDHFKSINDRFGHDAGDRVLVRVAALLLQVLRGSDIVVRTGGEEFVILMPFTDVSAAVAGCERVRKAVRDEEWANIATGMTVTTSVGVASGQDAVDLDALAKLADRRLYEAKRAGRDRVVAEGGGAVG